MIGSLVAVLNGSLLCGCLWLVLLACVGAVVIAVFMLVLMLFVDGLLLVYRDYVAWCFRFCYWGFGCYACTDWLFWCCFRWWRWLGYFGVLCLGVALVDGGAFGCLL